MTGATFASRGCRQTNLGQAEDQIGSNMQELINQAAMQPAVRFHADTSVFM